MSTFVVVGGGYRTQMFAHVAAALRDLTCAGVVVRTARETPAPMFTDLDTCLQQTRPDFVVVATSWASTPRIVTDLVGRGVPVLAETPPAPDLDGMRALWSAVGDSGLVQVAEQYLLLPAYAARLALVRSGVLGTPTQVQVSSTQLYHAVSLIRGLLGAGRQPVTARSSRFVAPLLNPLSRAGWTGDEQEHPATTTIATLDLGSGRSGVYDFTDNQTRNQLRFRRLDVRGSAGELLGDEVLRLGGPRTLLRTPLLRRQSGHDLDLIGFDTEQISFDGDVLWANPYLGQRWMDEEIAVATLLQQTARWAAGDGPPPYPLADGLHDHQVALAIEASAAVDAPVSTSVEPWTET